MSNIVKEGADGYEDGKPSILPVDGVDHLLQEPEISEAENRFKETFWVLKDRQICEPFLKRLGISVGDTIARESGENTFEYKVTGICSHDSHVSLPATKEQAKQSFKDSILKGDEEKISLMFELPTSPTNFMSIGPISLITITDEGFHVKDDTSCIYMKV